MFDTITELENDITQLNFQWMNLIGHEHPKDRDCHFQINQTWSYGSAPNWRVVHYGYWLDDIDEEFTTYEAALEFLKQTLVDGIKYVEEHVE